MLRLLIVLVALTTLHAASDEDAWLRPLGPPPKAKPERISGGESFPPLPLPVTPLRRSERKREPAAPRLVGKVVWGGRATFTFDGGLSTEVADWNQCPGDTQTLLEKSTRALGVNYGQETVDLASFHYEPERMPMLLFSGSRSIRLPQEQILALRRYVRDGGMLVFDSIAGSPWFHRSALELVQSMFPDEAIRALPIDHPFYHVFYDCSRVAYAANKEGDLPEMQGVYIGSRIGVLISPYGMGTGWDDRGVQGIPQAVYYDVNSASKLGVNLVAYCLGYAEAGRTEARPELHGSDDEQAPTDEVVFAQLRHAGAWNVHPGAAAALMARARRDMALDVSLRRVAVDAEQDDLAPYPLLYLTGLDDFSWSQQELIQLRSFLERSGTLIINNGLGLATFDAAVRRELLRLLPSARLEPVPVDHQLYSVVSVIREVRYSPAQQALEPELRTPRLEGISIDGDLRIIYAPIDLEAGWLGCDYPLARTYGPHDAVRLGMNILLYAATH